MTNNIRESIKVVCRLRPENKIEKDSGQKICVNYTSTSVKLNVDSDKKIGESGIHDFTFDKIFGPDSKQNEVFEFCAKPIIQSVIDGYNGTLLCYGQTSSGKTFTMEGVHSNEELKGIIPRMMEYVFDSINQSSDDIEFSVKCSFLEIYNEKIQDLLDPRKSNLLVKEEREKGIWVQDATEIYVGNKNEITEVFNIGTNNRSIAATRMNERSSRSHSIFILTIFQRNNKTESTKSGKLYFIDLAGSEKVAKTLATGTVLEEAKNINKSLMCLGMVINALTEGKTTHIPYRDSKLTRILQESLGGNSLTSLIITISMSSYNDKETLSTLRFGYRAKSIKNKPIVNNEVSAKELLQKLKEAEEKNKNYESLISELHVQLDSGSKKNLKNVYINSTNNNISTELSSFRGEKNIPSKILIKKDSLSSRCEDCGNAMVKILNQHIEIVDLQEEVENYKNEKNDLEEEIQRRNEEIFELNEKILINEIQSKLFFENEIKSYQEVQNKLDTMFINNQKKLIHTNDLRNLIEDIKNDIFLLIKFKNNKNNSLKDLEVSDIYLTRTNRLFTKFDELNESLSRLENNLYKENDNLNEIVDDVSKNTNIDKINKFNFNMMHKFSHYQASYFTENIKTNLKSIWNYNENKYSESRDNLIQKVSKMFLDYGADLKAIRRSKSTRVKSNSRDLILKICEKNIQINENSNKSKSKFTKTGNEEISKIQDRNIKTKLRLDFSKIRNKEMKTINKIVLPENNNEIITSQRKTIFDMSKQFQMFKDQVILLQKELKEKEEIIDKNQETIYNQSLTFEKLNEKLKELDLVNIDKDKVFEEYKERTMKDFSYKENQILELHNKISDLEDEKFRLLHFSKDKDKKKFYAMETQIKQFTNELQKLIQENNLLKTQIEKKDEEIKHYQEKLNDLENKLITNLKNKMKSPIDINSMNISNQHNNIGSTTNLDSKNDLTKVKFSPQSL